MKALVTGGAGFIGSHLCELLLDGGHEVSAIDDLSTGSFRNIAHLEQREKFTVIIDTVLNERVMEDLIRTCDNVFHLASAVGVELIIRQPVKTIETIVGGTEVVLKFAARYRKKVLITSTSEVYGKANGIPFSESDDTVHGPTTTRRWAYASAKALDEFLAFAHWHESQLPVVCARLFNTVGPRQTGHYGMVVPRFVEQALQGKPITVFGDGEQTRCFAHVQDVVLALYRLSSCSESFGKVVNIGNPEEVSMNELARRIIALTGSSSEILHVPYDEAYVAGFEDMRRRVPDITLARELIGFRPSRDLNEILKGIIAHQRNQATF